MSTSPHPPVDAPPRRRLLWRIVLVLFAVVLVGAGGFGYLWYLNDRDLREAEAEADRLDPGWRLADLEAARAFVPDTENSAVEVRAASLLLTPWSLPSAKGVADLDEEFRRLSPPVQLNKSQSGTLRTELGKVAPALKAARRLADMPRGRYGIIWSRDGVGTLMPHIDALRPVSDLLSLDVVLRAHDGDADGALASCRGLLNAGRSLGDEPAAVSQLTRLGCRRCAVQGLERALAQGEASDAALEAVQRLLEDEEKEPLQLVTARAERADIQQFLETLEAGEFSPPAYGLRSRTGSYTADTLLDRGRARAAHAAYLRYLTELVEIAKLPPEQQAERLRRPGLEPPRGVPALLEGLMRGDDRRTLALRFHANRGLLRCAAAAVAAERYRRAHGRWPDSLDALVPAYLAKVPDNPFDGQPLLYRRRGDEVTVEAPRSGADAWGTAETSTVDVGFRLWDPEHRRQAPGGGEVPAGPGKNEPRGRRGAR
jgi:hypothetical protein